MRRRVLAILGAFFVLCGLLACGSDATPDVARPRAPSPRGIRLELVIDRPGDTLAAIRAALPRGRARALVPGTTEDLVDALVELPDPALGRLDAQSPVRAVRIVRDEDDEDGATVAAARIRIDTLALGGGGPAGSRWLGSPGGAEEPAAAVLDDILVCADHRWALERALPYLATNAMRTPAVDEGVSIVIREGVPAVLRGIADAWIERTGERLLEGEESSAAAGAREVGADALRARVALLADVTSAVVHLAAHEGELSLRVAPVIREGSALAGELEGQARPRALGAVPEGTAIAWTVSAPDDEARADTLATLERGLGPLEPTERATLDTALRAWGTGWRESRVEAIGADTTGPWAAAWGRPGAPLDRDAIREGLRVPAVIRALGAQLGCTIEPGTWSESEGGWQLPLCPRARLEVTEREGTRLVALRSGSASGEPLTLLAADRSPSREVSLSGAVWGVLLVPSRARSAATIASVRPAAGARLPSGATTPDRIMQIRLLDTGELRASARGPAIADLVEALSPLGEDSGPPSD